MRQRSFVKIQREEINHMLISLTLGLFVSRLKPVRSKLKSSERNLRDTLNKLIPLRNNVRGTFTFLSVVMFSL